MICPKCGEENSDGFRYCGMCGTLLEARKPAGAPRVAPTTEAPRNGPNDTKPVRTPVTTNAAIAAARPVPPTTGPSFLGLNQPITNDTEKIGPSIDSLREHSFSGLDSFFEPEEPKVGFRRIVLLLILLGALGFAGWWAFNNYNKIGAISGNAPALAKPSASGAPAANTAAPNANSPAAAPPQSNTGASPPAAETTSPQTQNATPQVVEKKSEEKAAEKTEEKPEPKPEQKTAQIASAAQPTTETRSLPERKIARAEAGASSQSQATPVNDKGDAAFRKGEAYLYGRGVAENCTAAIKSLKEASAKQNAKARSTFGTMYATGHCVARDLPTSYSWFALALRVDPNNQILEKDLVAVWNQMTPPERQLATKMKQ